MKLEKETIEIRQDGKVIDRAYLNRGYPRGFFYFEHDGITAELAAGKTKQRAKAEELQRTATTLFNGAIEALNELSRLDIAAADSLLTEIYSGFSIAHEARPGGTNLKSLEQREAALFFAWQDAENFVAHRAGYDRAALLRNICFEVDDEYTGGGALKDARTGEALRRYRQILAEAEKETRRELTPAGRAIMAKLEAAGNALADCMKQGGPDEDERADKIMLDADAALDALALEDPEEATRIYRRSDYFTDDIGEFDVYIGHDSFCNRLDLKKLDTPEKRAAFIATGHFPGEGDSYADDLPPIIDGGEAVKLDSGEPVTLEGFTEPTLIG